MLHFFEMAFGVVTNVRCEEAKSLEAVWSPHSAFPAHPEPSDQSEKSVVSEKRIS
jgi:hypothetical protein